MLAINIQDVINVLSSVKTHLIVLGVALVVALAVIIACKALPVAKKKLVRSSALVALGLAVIIVVNTICFGPMFTMINLAMGGGSITEESMAEAYEVNTELVSEGVTLLENNGALPLASGDNLNVFGWASTAPVYGGVGSGALNDQYAVTDLITGLKNAGLNVNQDLVDFYEAYQAERPSVGMWAQDWTLPGVQRYRPGGHLPSGRRERRYAHRHGRCCGRQLAGARLRHRQLLLQRRLRRHPERGQRLGRGRPLPAAEQP